MAHFRQGPGGAAPGRGRVDEQDRAPLAAVAVRHEQRARAQIDLARPMFASPVKTETASAGKGEHESCGCMMTAIPGMSEKLGAGIDAIELIEKTVEGF